MMNFADVLVYSWQRKYRFPSANIIHNVVERFGLFEGFEDRTLLIVDHLVRAK